ncbi:TPA: hypothetical protein PC598_003952 [Morganella morganii]|nr:hypothetical protein [Morganella morganii]
MATYNQDSQFSLLNYTPEKSVPKSRITEMFSNDELLTPDGMDFSMKTTTTKLKKMLSEPKFNSFHKENKNAVFQVIHAVGWMDNESRKIDFKKRWHNVYTPNKEEPISLFNFANDQNKIHLLNQFSEILNSSSNTRNNLVVIDTCIMELYRQIPRFLYDFEDIDVLYDYGLNEATSFIKHTVDNAYFKSIKYGYNTSPTKHKICHALLMNEATNHVSQIIKNYHIGYSDIDFEFHPYKDTNELFYSNDHIDDDKLLNSAIESYNKKFTKDEIAIFKQLADLIFAIHHHDRGTKDMPRDAYSRDYHMRYIVYCFIICCKKNTLKFSLNNSGFGSRYVNIYLQLVDMLNKCNDVNPYDYIEKHYNKIEQQLTKYILNIISWLCRLYEIPSLRKGCSFLTYMNTRKMTWETVLYTYTLLNNLPFDTATKMMKIIKNESDIVFNSSIIRQRRMVNRVL